MGPTAGKHAGLWTDDELVDRFRAGEAGAFDELVQTHIHRLFALALAMLRDREDAEDATQEVLIKLHRQLAHATPPSRLRPWLYRVCVNLCTDRARSRRRQPVAVEILDTPRSESAPDPEDAAMASVMGRAIRTALANLPRRQRTALMLRHFAGLSVAEIAAALKCAPATVRVHLSRATRALRATLSDEANRHGAL